ncbi:DUF6933 domain-containing protein [Frigoriglobus tundricola]|uniref:DUF6933 domain-containing protein n=1 Tax=Frigoriglobus tundricola TaxID=2774151 RepID=A0A6M5Z721_9BACT|nr:hypothetical protein [Frigoriglobus tundricola]QJX01184.1 hypothetical protein FTUN_8823 [Frigoriglobus tundricola]
MIFRLSQVLNAKVKAGALEALPLHENPLLDWSAHSFPVGRSNFILVSNTGSLLSAVVSGKAVTNVTSFRERAFGGIRECLTALGHESLTRTLLADDNGPVRFAKTLNRSVSGSMNELVKIAEFCIREGELTLPEVGDRLNDTLLSALAAGGSHGYGKPREAFRVMVGGSVPSAPRSEAGDRHLGHEQPPPD